ncbi:MAG: hypothetical protein QOD59_3811 [Mycobacterium sp.]|jgi:hypothetical protein|nr:hypothetical protein [Mycobacterium sp.]
MKLAALHLRQRDGVTCGPTVAVVAGALLDPGRQGDLADPAWFADEQARVHAEVNRIWPRWLGTTPTGMARALTARSSSSGVRYRWRLFRGRRDGLSDVRRAVAADLPVAMLIGRFIPRHWVLIVDVDWLQWQCYEPSSGEVRSVEVAAVRRSRLSGLGYPRPFAFVLPKASTRSATT